MLTGMMAFIVGVSYLCLIAAGAAAGSALVLGNRKVAAIAAIVGICIVGGISMAVTYGV